MQSGISGKSRKKNVEVLIMFSCKIKRDTEIQKRRDEREREGRDERERSGEGGGGGGVRKRECAREREIVRKI